MFSLLTIILLTLSFSFSIIFLYIFLYHTNSFVSSLNHYLVNKLCNITFKIRKCFCTLSETERNRLSKKPRLDTTDNNSNNNSPIFNIKVPSTIQAKSNGRMAFAPLFEEERQKNVDRFFKMVKPSTNQKLFVDKFDKEPILPNVRSSGRSGINSIVPFSTIKVKSSGLQPERRQL